MHVLSTNAQKNRKPLPFPHLTDFKLEDIDEPVFTFEGVNYDELPPLLKKKYTDCVADYIRCSRQLLYHNPLCGYDTYRWKYHYFHSYCELEYQNCEDKHIKDRRYHVMGEGFKCELQRRFGDDNVIIDRLLLK
ncbi:unnamed protein product [Colias eurytheme]|nr:unnamed protein product [Colias eurytheme]